ncbi:MAG: tRNA (5-methylaminomethyl-2-thiouridine)(34)-methyltransferase MnmD [Bacteroidales bacterium]
MERKIITTEDGSHTLYQPELKEYYHSVHGAIQESKHVFIDNGLHYTHIDPVNILEIGFGTGLNAILTCLDALQNQRLTDYTAIEKYPLDSEVIDQLNYTNFFDSQGAELFNTIHRAKWGTPKMITSLFSITKYRADFTGVDISGTYDIVFFDAFAPEKQPDMWSMENFSRLFLALNDKGVLVTYSAKGLVKRRLEEVGFRVVKLPGPPGKREMIRAEKLD